MIFLMLMHGLLFGKYATPRPKNMMARYPIPSKQYAHGAVSVTTGRGTARAVSLTRTES